MLVKYLGWIVGTGKNINVWYDDWVSSTEQLRPYEPAPEVCKDIKVSDPMLANYTVWDRQKIDSILPFHKHVILQIKPSICNAPDDMVWLKSASGVHTAKSGSKLKQKRRSLKRLMFLKQILTC